MYVDASVKCPMVEGPLSTRRVYVASWLSPPKSLQRGVPSCRDAHSTPLTSVAVSFLCNLQQVGREKMTLRKQKRVGKDTLLRAERLLEDIKVVERLLRRMRCRDEKKEQLLEVSVREACVIAESPAHSAVFYGDWTHADTRGGSVSYGYAVP